MQNIFLLYSIATLKLLHQWLATRLVRRSSQPHPNGHFQIAKSEAAELARWRTFPDSTRWPSFARLTPSFEGHTSPLFGRVRQGLAKYGLPYEAAELARWRSMGRAGFEPAKA